MNVAITGASGFVGQNLLKYFEYHETSFQIIKSQTISEFGFSLNNRINVMIHLSGKAHDLKKISSQEEYYKVNTELTKVVYDAFLASNAKVFITLSSVKAIADEVDGELTEDYFPNPITHYGKSKLLAENYILSQPIQDGKRVYILRPCIIHGPGNKGNLNLLYSLVSRGLPWPLGSFENSRSYLSVENLCFIICEIIENVNIPSGVYNVADDVPLSTNEVIKLITETKGKKANILHLNRNLINVLTMVGDFFKLPFNHENLQKLTQSYVVNNTKLKEALGKKLPLSSRDGLIRTFQSFTENS